VTTTTEAIYRKGVFKPVSPVSLEEGTRVVLTIRRHSTTEDDAEHRAWKRLSQATLLHVWDQLDEHVFDRLLKK
jgi:predicted DNA-binding antitoxin AbrB/MazE fold protein